MMQIAVKLPDALVQAKRLAKQAIEDEPWERWW